jgi:hypothetical protein
MKIKLIVAFIFLALGVAKIVDWFIFCNQDNNFKTLNFEALKLKYVSRFPEIIKPLFTSKPEMAAVLSMVILTISGLIFLRIKKKGYLVIAILSFFLAFWNLFSIM